MHFLLTNDDGIDAPGLAALAQAVSALPHATFTIVAPACEQSQCGHRVTTSETLTLIQHGTNRYSVSGTPADCTRVALYHLGLKPDFVLSGINAGGNMGQDLPISGTMAGAREAAYHGVPAIAISHYLVRDRLLDWNRASDWAAQIISNIIARHKDKGEYWSVNLPHLPEGQSELPELMEVTPALSPLPVSFQCKMVDAATSSLKYDARYADRPQDSGSDVQACFGGKIAVCRLRL